MNKPIIIVAPQGAGKTTHAQALKEAFGCSRIVDEWNGLSKLLPGDLALTCEMPAAPQPRAEVMTLDAALAVAKSVA
ncbi:hypothetical protein ACGFZ7_16365 [Pseudomonas sp. NPDC047963]|nr:hypothetical protein [Pseudomonas sp.]